MVRYVNPKDHNPRRTTKADKDFPNSLKPEIFSQN